MTLDQRILFTLALAPFYFLPHAYAAQAFEIRAVSSRPDAVSGGATLAQLDAPRRP